MVMTILLHDANDLVLHQHGIQLNKLCCNELVYADDTLLLEIDARHLQVCMECIAKVGREYGLSLNWSKVEQINVNCQDMHLYDPDNAHINVKAAMKYLGASLSSDGHIEAEVAQRPWVCSTRVQETETHMESLQYQHQVQIHDLYRLRCAKAFIQS